MSIEALILGKLHAPAQQRTGTSSGRAFVSAKLRAATGDGETLFVNVVAFSESAGAALLALEAGDSVALSGTLKPTAWTDRDGNSRPSADMVAAQVLTTYGLKKKRAAVAAASAASGAPSASEAGHSLDMGEGDAWLNGGDA